MTEKANISIIKKADFREAGKGVEVSQTNFLEIAEKNIVQIGDAEDILQKIKIGLDIIVSLVHIEANENGKLQEKRRLSFSLKIHKEKTVNSVPGYDS